MYNDKSKSYSNLFLTQDIVRLKFRAQVYLNKVYGIVSNGKNAILWALVH
jgi:hypothetical protein